MMRSGILGSGGDMAARINSCSNSQPVRKLDRRNFLLLAAGAGAGLIGAATGGDKISQALGASTQLEKPLVVDKSAVVVVRNEKLFKNGSGLRDDQVAQALSVGVAALFDNQDPVKNWRDLFKPSDIVGIKVNCIAGPELSTHPQVVMAIALQLQAAGVPAENIIVWDRTSRELTRAGYTVNTGNKGIRVYGTDAVGYEEKAVSHKSFNGRLSKILTRQITALINVPILKDHSGAGVTISMKNHYGSIQNPGNHHNNLCDPYIADLNSVDEIRSKTRLIVCDATRASCNGGPGYNAAFAWRYCGLLISRDPVALDTIGTGIIDERREQMGLPKLEKIGRYPRQLISAADNGLGNTESARIDLRSTIL
ncbi:MAG: DUF362 domain-containing protein [Candidatus Abyssobacteria bacterium SURF_5]|uniref:DUF362 domain-containing protein n=1 Tax=Abyssobacteria bacterium (strain SURF_5) TaxID=2093360 RepID=A0A3A4MXT0_ABYX5|nr:MAG: DUF362 domain-containing protein [Candidatus Abyssubacteria bacterium SURF_5]